MRFRHAGHSHGGEIISVLVAERQRRTTHLAVASRATRQLTFARRSPRLLLNRATIVHGQEHTVEARPSPSWRPRGSRSSHHGAPPRSRHDLRPSVPPAPWGADRASTSTGSCSQAGRRVPRPAPASSAPPPRRPGWPPAASRIRRRCRGLRSIATTARLCRVGAVLVQRAHHRHRSRSSHVRLLRANDATQRASVHEDGLRVDVGAPEVFGEQLALDFLQALVKARLERFERLLGAPASHSGIVEDAPNQPQRLWPGLTLVPGERGGLGRGLCHALETSVVRHKFPRGRKLRRTASGSDLHPLQRTTIRYTPFALEGWWVNSAISSFTRRRFK